MRFNGNGSIWNQSLVVAHCLRRRHVSIGLTWNSVLSSAILQSYHFYCKNCKVFSRDSRIAALIANNPSLGRTLEQLVDQLNRCQRALNEFLEEKRSAFPRFYFLGDDDLLEIVGQSTNPAVIQSHLKKLFQGGFVKNSLQIRFSQESTVLHLTPNSRVFVQ